MSNIIELSAIRKAFGGADADTADLARQKSLIAQIAAVISELERASSRIHRQIAYIVDEDVRRKHMADANHIDALIDTARVRFEAALNYFLELNATPRVH